MFQPVFVLDCLLLYPDVGAGIRLECRIAVNSDIITYETLSYQVMVINLLKKQTGQRH